MDRPTSGGRNLKLTVAYDGTDYVGWQRQPVGRSIQGELERALAEIEGQAVTVHGAGRTDAGVHALAQVASLRLTHAIEAAALQRALNAKLPADIRVRAVEEVGATFHARFDARAKMYRYTLDPHAVADPFLRRYAWHLPQPLDVAQMRDGAAHLEGRHDFAAFQAAGTAVESTVRTIQRVSLEDVLLTAPPVTAPRSALSVEVVGDGFLRHMVRIMVGTLVEVGAGRRRAADLPPLLATTNREQAGVTAPAHGLVLVAVDY